MSIANDLSSSRINQAEECLQAAKLLFEQGLYKRAANSCYYCVFHSIRSILALDRLDFRSHYGVISKFRENYIKTGIFEARLSKIIESSFDKRTEGDYKDFITFTKDEIAVQLENVEYFYNQIVKYLKSINN